MSFFSRLPTLAAILDHNEQVLPWVGASLLGIVGYFFTHTPLTPITIVLALLMTSWSVGDELAPQLPRAIRPFIGLLCLLAAQSLVQTIWYYAGGLLGAQSDSFSLAGCIILFQLWFLLRKTPPLATEERATSSRLFLGQARWAVPLLFLSEALFAIILLFAHSIATTQAINTPWTFLPAGAFVAYFFLALCLWICQERVQAPIATAIISSVFLWSVACLAPLIYTLGFGFDGFLHRASEQVILTTGTLTPKPFYYIGQYVFVTWLSRLSGISIAGIDRWLVPFMSGLLPFLLLALPYKKTIQRSILALLCVGIPLSILTTTTPQSFAYLLGLGALFLAWSADHKTVHPVFALLLTSWALVTHPLAGLPFAALVTGILWIRLVQRKEWNKWIGWIGSGIAVITTTVCVPLAFMLQSLFSKTQVSWHTEKLVHVSTWWHTLLNGIAPPISHLALWPDWADTSRWLIPFFLLVGAIVAGFVERRERAVIVLSGLASIGLCLAGALMAQAGEFSFLINYERSNYADRLFLVAGLVLIPAALLGWAHIWERIRISPPVLICFWVVFFSTLSVGAVYGALPRHDAGVIGHGWSVGQADMESVKFIEKDAQGKPYTVLANQSVSAAAVANFGFKRYVGDIFYYPLPTGGPLYQLFLNVTAKPSLEPIQAAAALGQSSLVYVVLNAYWWNAEQVQESLKALSSRAWSVKDGETYVFRFDVSTSTKR